MTSYAWRSCKYYERIDKLSDVRAGDILVLKMGGRAGHVGIAVDDTMMIDASTMEGKIVRREYHSQWVRRGIQW